MDQQHEKQEKHHKKAWAFFFVALVFIFSPVQKQVGNHTDAYPGKGKENNREWNTKNIRKPGLIDSLIIQCNFHIRKGEFDQALMVAQQSLKLSKIKNDDLAIGNSLNKIATVNYYLSNFPEALFYYDESIAQYQKSENIKGVASSYNNKGAIYYTIGDFPKALAFYKEAVALSEVLEDKKQVAAITQNIGGIYVKTKDLQNAMKHYQRAKETYEGLSDKSALSQVINGIGEIQLRQGKYEQAGNNFDLAFRLAREIDDKQRIQEALLSLGDINEAQHNFQKALNYYYQAYDLAKKSNSDLDKSISQISIGSIYLALGKIELAILNCKAGLKIAREIKIISEQKEACDCLYQAYKSTSRNATALSYLEKSITLQDSLNAEETADEILSMQFEKELLLDSIAYAEKQKRLKTIHQQDLRKKEGQRNIIMVILGFVVLIALGIWSRLNYVRKSKVRLQKEKERSERLLLNILPKDIAEELKEKGYVDAQNFESAAILFTDFKSFTATASRLSPQELVQELNICFKAFDIIIDQYKIEKIKTIGDAYMAAGGVPRVDSNATRNIIFAALDMQAFMMHRKAQNALSSRPSFDMRVGIHVGPIVAGIVGVKKFQYDIWGDTVNTASRVESNGEVGKVNISKNTFLMVKDEMDLVFEYRGKIEAKGKGAIGMYFVSRSKEAVSLNRQEVRDPSLV